ncbi:MAG TPA: thioredoxin [Rectinemataceae bacterium]|nr:thioredoxin [Rectinemataceae bacterium]
MSAELAITAANFEKEVAQSELPVLIDFWAEWCMPCRMIAPSVADLAKTYAGRIKVASVDVDAENELATRFGIISIPTLIVFKDGKEYRKKVGAVPKHEIEALFKDLL